MTDRDAPSLAAEAQSRPPGAQPVPLPAPRYLERPKMPLARAKLFAQLFFATWAVTLAVLLILMAVQRKALTYDPLPILAAAGVLLIVTAVVMAVLTTAERIAWERETDRKVAERKLREAGLYLGGHDPRAHW